MQHQSFLGNMGNSNSGAYDTPGRQRAKMRDIENPAVLERWLKAFRKSE